jgi:DNA-directed RNA polymerase subunit M/transcription elongation factor TFIIS
VRGTACAQCGALIIAAQWSEHVNERRIRNVWSCDECGYEFETEVYFAASRSTVRELEVLEETQSDD